MSAENLLEMDRMYKAMTADRDEWKAKAERYEKSLQWYACIEHYSEDDWGVLSIITSPEYGNPGKIARAALQEDTP